MNLARVDSNGIDTKRGHMLFIRDVGEPRFNAQQPLDGAGEMSQIAKSVKSNSVRSQHSCNQFGTAWMAAKNFVGRKRGVQEEPNFKIGSDRSEQGRHEHQLGIMYPKQITLRRDLAR